MLFKLELLFSSSSAIVDTLCHERPTQPASDRVLESLQRQQSFRLDNPLSKAMLVISLRIAADVFYDLPLAAVGACKVYTRERCVLLHINETTAT